MKLWHQKATRGIGVVAALLSLASCVGMREITARNNGVKFTMWAAATHTHGWDYHGGSDSQNRAHGFGRYTQSHMGQIISRGNGEFVHGQPDGDHLFDLDTATGYHHFKDGKPIGMTKTRDDLPEMLVANALAVAASRSGAAGATIAMREYDGSTGNTANYPEGFAYNVTTYVGTSANVPWDFATIYGVTSYQTARQYVEAGKAIYGGDKRDRPGWFWIEKVPVRAGTNVKVGIQGVR